MNNEIKKNNQIIETRAEQLAERIEALVVDARKKITSTVNVAMVYTYFEVGRYIVEDEQDGKTRAEYGKGILKGVSARLTANLGKGWSVDTLEKTRRFFLTFSKSATPQRILGEGENSATVQRKFVYVNYYDRYVKEDFEKPTIGILLCERKNDALVELTLPKDANVYAQQYALCLPDKALLQQKLREWIAEFKNKEDVK
jgi:hypothetical protein